MPIFRKIILALLILSPLLAASAQQPEGGTLTNKMLAADANEYLSFGSGQTVEEIVASGKQYDAALGAFVLTFHPHEEVAPGRSTMADPLSEIKMLTLNSDAAIVATVGSCRSSLTPAHTFLFSDCEVSIDSIYSDKSHTLSIGGTAVVSRPGGTLTIAGVQVIATETEYPSFRQGDTYLLFLHALPSGSYYVGQSDAFIVKGGTLTPLRKHPKIDTGRLNTEQIEHAIAAAAEERQRNAR